MITIKVDGEKFEFNSWIQIHNEFSNYVRGHCEFAAESHCGCSRDGGEYCDCHENCVKDTLNQAHIWELISETNDEEKQK